MHYFQFSSHKLSRVFKGNWQLAGGHGKIDKDQAIEDLFRYVEHGVNTFDVGDIYTGAEEILGEFLEQYRAKYGAEKADEIRIHTKFVPDLNALADLTYQDTRKVIERSLKRLRLDKLHLVQFHWWDYNVGDFVKAAQQLQALADEGLIEDIGVTNFDTAHLEMLLDAGVKVKSNQIQFSLIDPRPQNGMLQFAKKHNIAIFCYGTLAGGLLAGATYDPLNRSHIKYDLMANELKKAMGEAYYSQLLQKLAEVAKKHNTTIGNVATRCILDVSGVSAIIVGPRNTVHLHELDDLFELDLSGDKSLMGMIAKAHKKIADDIYSYERDRSGAHGSIMKYNLNNMRE